MNKILVIGASGNIGSELSRLLKNKGREVWRATSQKKSAPDQVHLDLLNQDGLKTAVSGVEKVFLMPPPAFLNPAETMIPVIDEAKKSGVRKIVYLSALGADKKDGPAKLVEQYLEKSGMIYSILRPNWFMQNFNTYWIGMINSLGKILLPVENAKSGFIDTRDIASVAAELLLSDEFNNQGFDFTGGELLNHDEVAKILSTATGRQIVFENITPAQTHEIFLQAGISKEYSEFLLISLEYFRQGYTAIQTDWVEKITGKKPRTFKTYAEDHKEMWATH